MLDELVSYHQEVMASVDVRFKRYLFDKINWKSKAICIYGGRGVGKTTMLCQYFLETYKTVDKALYISADHVQVTAVGLLNIANEYFAMGGKALFIDEVHKYPNWSVEIKNILDAYRKHQIIFSGSSAMELKKSKADLSRRVVYKELPGLSFREYLEFKGVISIDAILLNDILKHHTSLSVKFKDLTILKHFKDYLEIGYYPFFLEGIEDYLIKLNNVIEKIITEDIAFTKSIKPGTIIVLKKLLWLVATSNCFIPNIDKISRQIGVTREIIYDGFEYLEQGGLIHNVYPRGRGLKLIRKPGKIFANNTNLLNAINGTLKMKSDDGSARETFFVNQLALIHNINVHDEGDFIIDQKYVFEIGGKSKTEKQIKSVKNAYLGLDGIQIGLGNRIPLYLFGCLY